jgi:hypothetical protein
MVLMALAIREEPDREPTDGQEETEAAQAIPEPCHSSEIRAGVPA